MATAVSQVPVATPAQLEQMVSSYIAQGFTVANRTPDSVTMLKKKEFNILWAVIGLVVCLLPLLVYLIVYATQQDQMVEIRLDPAAAALGAVGFQMSPDGAWWWDGKTWQDPTKTVPPTATYSNDGAQWWDGCIWRPVSVKANAIESGVPSHLPSENGSHAPMPKPPVAHRASTDPVGAENPIHPVQATSRYS